jgi:hypothetical protein
MEGNRARLRGWDAFVATGVMYQNGNDVSKDYAAAMEWYRRGAKLLNADAQLNIGPLYRSGLGVQQDYCTAMAWYLKAAEQGLVDAQVEVASLYRYGHGASVYLPGLRVRYAFFWRLDFFSQSRRKMKYQSVQGICLALVSKHYHEPSPGFEK